jgi:hypothetical protein
MGENLRRWVALTDNQCQYYLSKHKKESIINVHANVVGGKQGERERDKNKRPTQNSHVPNTLRRTLRSIRSILASIHMR